jgi:hypothetical protein
MALTPFCDSGRENNAPYLGKIRSSSPKNYEGDESNRDVSPAIPEDR